MSLTPIVTDEQRELLKLQLMLNLFNELSPTMPLQVAQTFLLVCIHEGCSLTDLLKRTGWSQSTLSRHLLDLGKRNRHKEPGLNLVDSQRDPMELRKNIYTPTPKGRKLIQELLDLQKLGVYQHHGDLSRQEEGQDNRAVESGSPEEGRKS